MLSAEQNIIGCILMDSDCIYQIYDTIKPEMFQYELTRDCYREALAMYDRGDTINLVTVAQKLENHERSMDFIGEQLSECLDRFTTTVALKGYADTLIKEYRAREVKELIGRVDVSPNKIDNSISEMLARLEELQANDGVKSKSLAKIVEENKDNYFKETVGENAIKTGFGRLDDCLGGLEKGDITVIGARPGVGKSALVTQIIGQVAKCGGRIGYFNLEMNESQVYERFVSRLAQLKLTRIRRAKAFLGGEKEAFEKANDEMKDYDVIVSTGGKTVSQIRNESRHQNFDLIVIDYLQLVRADKTYSNRASEVGYVSKTIKAMAMELGVHIILLSQLNRTSETKETKEPTMAELRESGDIEQDASNIVLMWNMSESNKSYKGLKVDKQRQGENMKEGLVFNGEHMEFQERYHETFEQFAKRVKENDKAFQSIPDNEDIFGSWGG